MTETKEEPVVAGIIDIKNNEIIETTRNPAEKTFLRLKVRDELVKDRQNPDHVVFDVGSSPVGNLNYIRDRHLKNASDILLYKLDLLQVKYRQFRAGENLEERSAALSRAKETVAAVMASFGADPDKRQFLTSAFSSELEAIEDSVSAYEMDRNHFNGEADKLEARIADLSDAAPEAAPLMSLH